MKECVFYVAGLMVVSIGRSQNIGDMCQWAWKNEILYHKQDRQRRRIVTSRRILVTIVTVQKQKILNFKCLVPSIVLYLCNINQKNVPFLINILIFIFFMSSTCFETKGSSSGRRFYVYVWYTLFCLQDCI